MNIHLVNNDPKFINKSYEMFEKYYPGQNIFVVHSQTKKTVNVKKRERVFFADFSYKNAADLIIKVAKGKINRLIVHSLTPKKAAVSEILKSKYNCKTYWVLYGVDLYHYLNKKGKYELYDDKKLRPSQPLINKLQLDKIRFYSTYKITPDSAYRSFIKNLDYFCFWNTYEYELLKKYIPTNAKFKYFRYYAGNFIGAPLPPSSEQINILVNNSASYSGNHLTVLQKLKSIGAAGKINKLIVPLSYGSDKVKQKVIDYGKKHFPKSFYPLVDFLPADEYFKILSSVNVAIFGNRRQEGGNNIYYALCIGAKIFLRKENNIAPHLNKLGYKAFDFEKDLNHVADLIPLDDNSRQKNNDILAKECSLKKIDEVYGQFFGKG